jgi:hypothetical protein
MLSPHAVVLRDGRRTTSTPPTWCPATWCCSPPATACRPTAAAAARATCGRRVGAHRRVGAGGQGHRCRRRRRRHRRPPVHGLRRHAGHAGPGEGVVVATGAATEIGRIGRLLASVETGPRRCCARWPSSARTLTLAILGAAARCSPSARWCAACPRPRCSWPPWPRGRRHPRRAARHHDHYAGHRRAAHGGTPRHHSPHAGGGDAGHRWASSARTRPAP